MSARKDLERMVWAAKHRDYKSVIDGKRYVTIFRTGKGTCLEPLASITDADLITMLPSASQAEFANQLHVGQRFDYFGQVFEITKIERNKDRTIRIARLVSDGFGKETLIDARSFPARDFDRQHLRPL